MSLFSKKKSPPAAPPVTPPVAPAPPAPPKTENILKLPLPDVFAFQRDATRPELGGDRRRRKRDRGVILLVETDDEIRRLLSRLLQHEAYELRSATCLAEAREMLKEQPADYVLARRACVPLNLETQIVLQDISRKVRVRIVDEFSDLIMGQVVDYESLSQCLLSVSGLLMSLLEGARTDHRGHAQTVAKYCRLIGQRLGMSRRDLDALTLAAYLHDIGPVEIHHRISDLPLTGEPPAETPSLQTSLELLANMPAVYSVNELLAAVHERADADTASSGAPPPPLGARILRVVETYDTLRRRHADQLPDEAAVFEWMRRQPSGMFDADALETLIHIRRHERAINSLQLFSQALLLVTPQPEQLHLLSLRLQNDDYKVLVAHSVPEALEQLRLQRTDLVLTDYRFPGEQTGFELLRTIKEDIALRDMPVVFYDVPQTDLVKRALEMGAEDWYPKPGNVEIIALKLERILQRVGARATAAEGVQGHLRDLPLLDMVQILSASRRSVQIQLRHGGEEAELFLHDGQIVNAICRNLEGEAAALELLRWEEGSFWMRPLRQPPPARITTSTDALLLQSCADRTRSNLPQLPTP